MINVHASAKIKSDMGKRFHSESKTRREPKAIFCSMIGWYLYKKEKTFFSYLAGHVYFSELLVSVMCLGWKDKCDKWQNKESWPISWIQQ